MTARTCQLCGKSLSRLRVGGDGDFCSREHRNQHRLRAGMDRLEEANKVTSLMRRRENPRHISAARLMCNSAQDRRGFFEAKHPSGRTDITGFFRTPPAPPPRRGSPVPTGMWRPVPRAWPQLSHRGGRIRPVSASVAAAPAPLVPPRRQKLPVQISHAPLVSLHCDNPAPIAAPRNFGMLRQTEIRVHLGAAMASGALGPRRA